jgi:hypothetical protein
MTSPVVHTIAILNECRWLMMNDTDAAFPLIDRTVPDNLQTATFAFG